MTRPASDAFTDRVLTEVERNERRRGPLVLALTALVLVLAVPAVVALRAHAAVDAASALAREGLLQAVSAASDNPAFWAVVASAAIWGGWLACRAAGGRRR